MQVHNAGDGDKLVTIGVAELAALIGVRPDEIQVDHVSWNDALDKVYIVLTPSASPDESRNGSLVDIDNEAVAWR